MAEETVVRRLTVTSTNQGVDQTTASLKNMATQTENLATVTDISSRRAISAEEAYRRQLAALDPAAKAQIEAARATRANNEALAQGIITAVEYAQRIKDITDRYTDNRSASDDASEGFKLTGDHVVTVGNHIRQAAEAAYVLSPAFRALVNPAIFAGLGLIGTAFGAMSPLILGVAGRVIAFLAPLAQLYAAVKIVAFAWTSATEQIEKYVKLSADATAGNVSAEYLQRLGQGFVELGGKIEDATEFLKKFNAATDSKLGGSEVQKKIDQLVEFGNFNGNKGVQAFKDASDPQTKLEALNVLFKQAVADGERLAGLDLTSTFLSPASQEALKQNSNYLDDILSTARKVEETKLAKQEDVDIANSLNQRYEAAAKILGERFIPFQTAFTAAGTLLHMVWVGIVEAMASIATKITNIVSGTYGFFQRAWKTLNYKPSDDFIGPMNPSDDEKKEAAIQKLRTQLANKNNVDAAKANAEGTYNNVFKDTSKSKKVEELGAESAAYDRAKEALLKYIGVTSAAAETVGKTAFEQEKAKATAQLLAGAIKDGSIASEKDIDWTSKLGKEIQDLGNKAAEAAQKRKLATIDSNIDFTSKTALLSPEDAAIANQLRGAFDSVEESLKSSQAEAIRFNNNLKQMGDLARSSASAFTTDLVSGLRSGKSLMDSLGNAAANLSTSLTNGAINSLFSGNYGMAAVQGIGAVVSGIFGNSSKKRQEEEAARKKAAEAEAAAVAAAAERTQAYTDRLTLSGVDQNTLAGQLQAFDINAQKERRDEAANGNRAIVSLEAALAAERQAIIDKSNAAIKKSMNDFLESIKTGSKSILSPEEQLKYQQNLFNTQLSGAQGGNQDDLGNITSTASKLLDIAQSFFASGSGYAAIYEQVTNAINGLAGNKLPGMAAGGIVGNGTYNMDSVVARYAGGGSIALAGGEAVTRAASVNPATMGTLSHINRTGRTPGNDNSQVVAVLAQGFNGQTMALTDKLDLVIERLKRLDDTTRQTNNRRPVPGEKKAA